MCEQELDKLRRRVHDAVYKRLCGSEFYKLPQVELWLKLESCELVACYMELQGFLGFRNGFSRQSLHYLRPLILMSKQALVNRLNRTNIQRQILYILSNAVCEQIWVTSLQKGFQHRSADASPVIIASTT